MKRLLTSAAVLALLATPVFAQSSNSQVQSNPQSAANSSQNIAAAQKIKKDLQDAGFSDVKVVAESFVVQARSKDGDPVLMTIGPHGMSVFEAMNATSGTGSNSGSTTGSSSSTSSNSTQQNNQAHQSKPAQDR
jgi:opacity protein-like surface antigen